MFLSIYFYPACKAAIFPRRRRWRALVELGGQKSLRQVSSHFRSNSAPAHAQNIHVIVFDILSGREMIVNQQAWAPLILLAQTAAPTPLPQTARPRPFFQQLPLGRAERRSRDSRRRTSNYMRRNQ
jgi:hypothetical protein